MSQSLGETGFFFGLDNQLCWLEPFLVLFLRSESLGLVTSEETQGMDWPQKFKTAMVIDLDEIGQEKLLSKLTENLVQVTTGG